MTHDTPTKFSPVTVGLHWLVGGGMLIMLIVGWAMSEFDIYRLYPIHKSIGILLFIVIVLRVIWRAMNGWQRPLPGLPDWKRKAARVSHWILITGTVLMPVSGMLMSALGGRGLAVFGVPLVALNRVDGEVVAINEAAAHFFHSVHHFVGPVVFAVAVLHIAAALHHHFAQKDNVLRRMLGREVPAQS